MANSRIRGELDSSRVRHWEVADYLGVSECTFSRWLRHELTEAKQQEVLEAIQAIKQKKEG